MAFMGSGSRSTNSSHTTFGRHVLLGTCMHEFNEQLSVAERSWPESKGQIERWLLSIPALASCSLSSAFPKNQSN
jgi:hypothetical protein